MLHFHITPKIRRQLSTRGWTAAEIQDVLNSPQRTSSSLHTGLPMIDRRTNDPAIAYIRSDGHGVIRKDRTGEILHISDRTDAGWKPYWR